MAYAGEPAILATLDHNDHAHIDEIKLLTAHVPITLSHGYRSWFTPQIFPSHPQFLFS